MKKRMWAFALLILTGLLLTGCHGARGSAAFVPPASFDTAKTYEITFWAKNDTNKVQQNIYAEAIRDFEALYPNIHVSLKLYTDYGRIYNDVITNISTGTTPNVCITYPDHIATYLTGSNTVVPLDELFTDKKYGLGASELKYDGPARDEMVEKFLTECAFGGHYYAVPYVRSTEACYVNKTYVEKLGYTLPEKLTWDFVWEVSEAAMAKNADGTFAVNGQNVMIPFIYKSTDNMMIQMVKQLGAGYSTSAGEILLFNDETKDILKTVAEHGRTGAFSTFKISSYPANFLNAGQCIFAVDSTAGSTWMGSEAPLLDIPASQLVKFETAVMEIPQYNVEDPQMISQGPSICIFNKEDPQEVLASWIFMQYMLTNEVQIAYAETEGYAPVTEKALNAPEYQEYLSLSGTDADHYSVKIDATKLLMEHVDQTFVTPVFNGSASLRDAAGTLIEETVKAVQRKKNVDDAYITDMFGKVVTLYHLEETGSSGKADLGPLPDTAVALLASLAAAWILIGAFFLRGLIKARKKH